MTLGGFGNQGVCHQGREVIQLAIDNFPLVFTDLIPSKLIYSQDKAE
jgi:hypothetical protein